MSTDEEEYKKELAKAGVDLPELKAEKPEDAPKPEPEKEDADGEKEPLKEEKPKEEEPKRPSIYDVYKGEKSDRKAAEARAEQAEKERDELQRKLEDASKAKDGTDADEAEEDALEYAKKVNADPELVKRIIADARKGFESKADPDVAKRLDRFEAWEKANAKTMELQRFNEEFASVTPFLKETFPNASDEEMKTIREKLDAVSHTKDWHDKALHYIAFMHKDELSALVSPKKRGMETKGRKDVQESSFEFDPNADYSKMTMTERKEWEKHYNAVTKSDSLITDGQGRKLLL